MLFIKWMYWLNNNSYYHALIWLRRSLQVVPYFYSASHLFCQTNSRPYCSNQLHACVTGYLIGSTAKPVSDFCPWIHSLLHRTGNTKELTLHVTTLDSWRSRGVRELGGRGEALLLIPWDIGLSGVTDAQKILKELSPSCPQQWIIALQRILVLPFPPSMLPLPGSSPLFPGITAQNELSHANLWMRLWFPGDCENGHREGVGMGEWQWEVSRLRNRSLTPHKYGSSL